MWLTGEESLALYFPHHDTSTVDTERVLGWWLGECGRRNGGIKRAPFVWRRAIGSGFLS